MATKLVASRATFAAQTRPAAVVAQLCLDSAAHRSLVTSATHRRRRRTAAAPAVGATAGSSSQAPPPQPPPAARLRAISNAFIQSQALYTAARLRVADALAEGPLPNGELAQRLGAHPERLYRVLRMLAVLGVFQESDPGEAG